MVPSALGTMNAGLPSWARVLAVVATLAAVLAVNWLARLIIPALPTYWTDLALAAGVGLIVGVLLGDRAARKQIQKARDRSAGWDP